MSSKLAALTIAICLQAVLADASAAAPLALAAADLRTEHLVSPLGVDVASPLLTWAPRAAPGARRVAQAGFRIEVARDAAFANVAWASGAVGSSASAVRVPAENVARDTRYFWRVVWSACALNATGACDGEPEDAPASATASFHTGLAPETWAGAAAWLSCATVGACDYLRSPAFALDAPPLRATLHLATGGWTEAWVNGARAGGDAALEGSWTQWNMRMPTTAYDVTALLAVGANAVGLVLGNGWWGHLGHRATAAAYLSIELAAGERLTVGTDPGSWRGSAGPIVGDDIYNGESYVMAQEIPGWSTGAFNISAWDATTVVADPYLAGAARSWQAVQPVVARRAAPVAAMGVAAPSPTQFVVEFPVNSAGWTQLRLPGGCPAGAAISLLHAENLAPDGTVDQGNLRSAAATDVLTCDGRAEAFVYEPRFTYHGFRYVGVQGWPTAALGAPAAALFAKIEAHNAVEYAPSGDAAASSIEFAPGAARALPLIHDIVRRGQLSNLHGGVPTDCPQRDERQGWAADASVSAESALSSFDMHALYASWLRTIVDSQRSADALDDCDPSSPIFPDCEGADTDTSPHVKGLFGNRPADPSWGAALDIIYDLLLRYYNDTDLAGSLYPALTAYADFLLRVADAQGGLVTFHYCECATLTPAHAPTSYPQDRPCASCPAPPQTGTGSSRTRSRASRMFRSRRVLSTSCARCALPSTPRPCSARRPTPSATRRAFSPRRRSTIRAGSTLAARAATARAARTSKFILFISRSIRAATRR